MDKPILYSFRRCPYAMRARLALAASGFLVELREVILRDKPIEMLEASPKGTVPVMLLPQGDVLEESRDIMNWVLAQADLEGWIDFPESELVEMAKLIDEGDGPFKAALDAYKYGSRDEMIDTSNDRSTGAEFIKKLDGMLDNKSFLFDEKFSVADGSILPFIRQFAHVDKEWFWAQDWPNVIRWLEAFLESERFKAIMTKYPQWKTGDDGVNFGG